MAQTIHLAIGTVDARLVGADPVTLCAVSDLLSYRLPAPPGAAAAPTSSMMSPGGRFPSGFAHLVETELRGMGHDVRVVRSRPVATPLGPADPIVDAFGNDDPDYDFQPLALRQVEAHGRGIVQIATGGGKSKVAKLIHARFGRKTLFLTTRAILMHQMAAPYVAAGEPVGVVGEGEWRPSPGMNVGMVQTLVAALDLPDLQTHVYKTIGRAIAKAKGGDFDRAVAVAKARESHARKVASRAAAIAFLETVEVVIGEEAHEAGGQGYFDILRHCGAATIRVALTATPFMRDGQLDNMRLMAAFGPVLVRVPESLLIDRGILARPVFRFLDAPLGPRVRRTTPYAKTAHGDGAYVEGVVRSGPRNAAIVEAVSQAAARSMPAMVLVQRTDHGDALVRLLGEAGVRAAFIRGEDDAKGRKAALAKLGSGAIDCLVGTTILDVGVDVPAVSLVVLAGGGKAEVALRQRIGRGLRRKRDAPNFAFVLDFRDTGNATLADHARARHEIIRDTEGFADGVLPPGQDFPWALFGPSKR